ncbi:MAG TPA: Rne/Rng family ribonuclease [Thermoanaerobaculia bacterium]|nr:Rne/Rng family ribonuclease [Thermoanaerobaculia bacterium]
MSHKMLVESDPHQTRIAVLEADRLTEVFIERRDLRGVVGNIYKGRVTRVLPGMQAAFVDIGLERDAFLYVSDVVELDGVEDDEMAGSEAAAAGAPGEGGGERADDGAVAVERAIEELLEDGQELLVQVTKDPLHNKGARVTTHVTLPSRCLVLLPSMRHLGVSRRIEDEPERERLRLVLEELREGDYGLIVRTVGEGRSREELAADRDYLIALWSRIADSAARVRAPTLLHRDLDLALRVVRDSFNEEFSVLWVEGEQTYQRIVEFLDQVQPTLTSRVKLEGREGALFDRFDIDQEIEAALGTKVWLKSGGYLVINQTEALVAIDVNTGRYVGQRSLEETVLATNLEAVREIVRQIRLRDLSGILIVDLIDMSEPEHRDRVFAALEEELKKDRAKSKVLQISEFGVVEITRKRSHANLERSLTRACPYCRGTGRIKSTSTICLQIRAEVMRRVRRSDPARELLLRVHPEVSTALQNGERAIFDELERTSGSTILLRSDPELHRERFDLSEL